MLKILKKGDQTALVETTNLKDLTGEGGERGGGSKNYYYSCWSKSDANKKPRFKTLLLQLRQDFIQNRKNTKTMKYLNLSLFL